MLDLADSSRLARHAIPTAGYRVLTDADEALRLATTGALGWPLVIKADGLAAGKGVVVAADRNAATDAVTGPMRRSPASARPARG
jgi:phosphoribosylamine---glycine ligase